MLIGVIVLQWRVLGKKLFNRDGNLSKTAKIATPTVSLPKGVILVKGYNYGFSPREITVKEGEVVKIRLVSDDSPHTFTIEELGVDQEFTYGKDANITFTAGKKGTFQIYCAVPGHKEGGMIGVLNVI